MGVIPITGLQGMMPRAGRSLRLSRPWVLAPLVIGICLRIIWALTRDTGHATGEAANIAIAIAQGRGFADAFAVGQGPTAHLLPISPTIAGGVYAMLGVYSVAAQIVLLLWALFLTLGAFWLFAGAFLAAGSSRRAVTTGFAILCVVPIYTTTEVYDFGIWEGALALLLGGMLLRLLSDGEAKRRWPFFGLWLAALPALTFFVGPPVGLAAISAWAMFVWEHRRRDGFWRRGAGLLLALAVLIAPWTARNMMVLGHPIWLRDNAGLELAIANHPAAVHPANARETLDRRIEEIHPFASPAAYRRLQAVGGEVAYSRMLGAQTLSWMRAHPADVATIWLGHLRLMVFPDEGPFMTKHGRLLPIFRAAVIDGIGLFGLLGIAMAIVRRDRQQARLIGFALIPVVCYAPFHPVIRYMWLVYPALTCFAADAVARLAGRLAQLRRGRDIPPFAPPAACSI